MKRQRPPRFKSRLSRLGGPKDMAERMRRFSGLLPAFVAELNAATKRASWVDPERVLAAHRVAIAEGYLSRVSVRAPSTENLPLTADRLHLAVLEFAARLQQSLRRFGVVVRSILARASFPQRALALARFVVRAVRNFGASILGRPR